MIGISYHAGGLQDLPLEDVIKILADTGYDAIEMMCGPDAHIDSNTVTGERAKQVKKMVDNHNLAVSVVNHIEVEGSTNWH